MTRSEGDDPDGSTLRVAADRNGDWTVLAVHGELDIASAQRLEEALSEAVRASPRVVVDLSGVLFMDSTGLGVLMRAHKQQNDAGGTLRLAAPSERVVRILDITGLDTVFAIYPSVGASQVAPVGDVS